MGGWTDQWWVGELVKGWMGERGYYKKYIIIVIPTIRRKQKGKSWKKKNAIEAIGRKKEEEASSMKNILHNIHTCMHACLHTSIHKRNTLHSCATLTITVTINTVYVANCAWPYWYKEAIAKANNHNIWTGMPMTTTTTLSGSTAPLRMMLYYDSVDITYKRI